MKTNENISGLYEELDNEIMDIFSLSMAHREIIKKALVEKNAFLSRKKVK